MLVQHLLSNTPMCIDIPTSTELIADNKEEHEIAIAIGADKIFYNDLQDVIDSCSDTIRNVMF